MGHQKARSLTQGPTDSWGAGMWMQTCLPGGCAFNHCSWLLSSFTGWYYQSGGPWTPRTSIDELQKGVEGESPECSKKCAFPLWGVSMHLIRFSDPINIRASILESYSVVRLWQVEESMANWAEQDEDSDWMEQTRSWMGECRVWRWGEGNKLWVRKE